MPTVEDVLMTKGPDVIVADLDDTVLEVCRVMAQGKVGSVIVKDGDAIVGIFTERDLLCKVIARGKDPASVAMSEVMSSPVKTCRLSDDFQTCAAAFAGSHIRHMAVVEEGALVGIIGVRDILGAQLGV